MTSGIFETVPIHLINVVRADRIRKEMKPESIAALADSISRIGLIHPPVIRRDFSLVAGENRLEACKYLGWTALPIQWSDALTENEVLEIELEENIKRTDLPWQDQVAALRRYHELKREAEPTWTQDQTAEALGISRPTVTQQLAVAVELAKPDSKIAEIRDYSVARGKVSRSAEREAEAEIASLKFGSVAAPSSAPILTADFNEWAKTYDGAPFNLLSMDPPYGIDADKHRYGAADSFGGYEDSAETYWRILRTVIENKERLLGDSAHIILWFSIRYYTGTLDLLETHDFRVDPVPLIWFKSDNNGIIPDPQRGPRRIYETAFLISHGDRKIVSPVANAFAAPVTRTASHMSEKNQAMQEHFFRMVVDGTTRMLDPTCGSGTSLRAAEALGAKSVLGLELNPAFVDEARRAWDKRNEV